MVIGVAIGSAIGVALGNIGVGIAVGFAMGLAIGGCIEEEHKRKGQIKPLSKKEIEKRKRVSWIVFFTTLILFILLFAIILIFR